MDNECDATQCDMNAKEDKWILLGVQCISLHYYADCISTAWNVKSDKSLFENVSVRLDFL